MKITEDVRKYAAEQGIIKEDNFTMRLIGNKTRGDLAEIGITEFINQFMYDFKAEHVGKDRFRAKECEEDIEIINEISKAKFPLSLKAYGVGHLQLSTDKSAKMYGHRQTGLEEIVDKQTIAECWNALVATDLQRKNILALIYEEKRSAKKFNVFVFNAEVAKANVVKIVRVREGGRRLHPVYRFLDSDGVWVCEVRYGGGKANALQRGLWSHTQNAKKYFDRVTDGWIDYSHNDVLVRLFPTHLLPQVKAMKQPLKNWRRTSENKKAAPISPTHHADEHANA
jgi:hypothetical protein